MSRPSKVRPKKLTIGWVVFHDKYSFKFKLHVIELYLTSEVSYQELAISQGITNYAILILR